ncbi:hypothetical protein EDB92DRAFT_2106542 [Lactarius akahatsu]|uniref:Uncharacterized protein n=1 Tax=Lactarius akahatsu TaxID=416441 RepID=A0AAD4L973_9AGAM|nr:hypothetical protein EDB92DRAFT_2106542 [Lactarius akahatsu]
MQTRGRDYHAKNKNIWNAGDLCNSGRVRRGAEARRKQEIGQMNDCVRYPAVASKSKGGGSVWFPLLPRSCQSARLCQLLVSLALELVIGIVVYVFLWVSVGYKLSRHGDDQLESYARQHLPGFPATATATPPCPAPHEPIVLKLSF